VTLKYEMKLSFSSPLGSERSPRTSDAKGWTQDEERKDLNQNEQSIFSGQYFEKNPGQYLETNPGQYHEDNPGQYFEENPGKL